MKRKHASIALLTVGAAFSFIACQKSDAINDYQLAEQQELPGQYRIASSDRIDEIVKGLAIDHYTLSFNSAIPNAGITRTAYGADNYLTYADPQDLICPEPFRLKQKRVPIWKLPTFIWPTCPDMIIDINRLSRVQELLAAADRASFGKLQQFKLSNGGGLLADERFTGQFRSMQLDKIDELTRDLNGEKYIMFQQPGDYSGGFTRSFYGYADLPSLVFKPYRKNLKDLLKPKLKGCFDPLVLTTIKERLQKIDPVQFKTLKVTPIAETKSVAVLAMY